MRPGIFAAVLAILLPAGAFPPDQPDLEVVQAIKQAGLENSQVMDHLHHLVEVFGNRLTNSPGFQAAGDWAVQRLKQWGLSNVAMDQWGPFGQGWALERFSAHLLEPGYEALIGAPLGWTPGTGGPLRVQPQLAVLERSADPLQDRRSVDEFMQLQRGQLEGKAILIDPPRTLKVSEEALHRRLSEADLASLLEAPAPEPPETADFTDPNFLLPADPERRRRLLNQAPEWFREKLRREARQTQNDLNAFLVAEGVRLVIHTTLKGDGGTLFPPRTASHRLDDTLPPPSVALTPEQYNRIYRLLERRQPVELEVEIAARFFRDNFYSFNVVGELPGQSKADELVILGAHLDSVETGLGATDNAAGCAVMMEAVRILQETGLGLDRTVRLILWGGEEQGLLGSRDYVRRHFGDPASMTLQPGHSRLSVYLNLDNGTGRIRGVYLQGNEAVRPIFRAWLAPFQDMGAETLTIRGTGGTDHLSFDAVGLPAFQFIQDPIEYDTRSHHSSMDVLDRIQAPDLMQAAVIIASFAYHAANRPERLPRKPLPEPTRRPTRETASSRP